MTPEHWKEVERLFHEAVAVPVSERRGFLLRACADEQLRREIESLLRGHDGASLLDRGAIAVTAGEMTSSMTMASPGRTIDHYEVLSFIGKGGMGEVYLARDTRLNRTVALKLLPASGDAASQSRFLREARLAATLDHPNICTVFDVGESDGQLYIAMQYVEGRPLRQVIDGRPMSLDTVLKIATQVSEALVAAHRRDIIHRDIKPDNIIVNSRGDAKVLDFGLAKSVGDVGPALTGSHWLLGTPAYMSPEQARGERVDRRSDIFSFGVVLYEMATGQSPFRRVSSVATMNAIIGEPHPPVRSTASGVPAGLVKIIDRALVKDLSGRYATMDELATDLRTLAPTARADQSRPAPRRTALIATAAALVIVLALAGWYSLRSVRETSARNQIPHIEELATHGRFFEAYQLGASIRQLIPADPKLTRLMRTVSDTISVSSTPPGARVSLRGFVQGVEPVTIQARFIGTTPLSDVEIARGEYIARVELDGYTPFEGSVFGFAVGDVNSPVLSGPLRVAATLTPAAATPAHMAYVPAGDYRLVSWRRPSDAMVKLDGYFIDRYEVSNQDYKDFVAAGGYLKKEFWTHPFVKSGREISWEAATQEFLDRTRLPGPRGWANQDYPPDKARHPVTGISWYEAAAYAAFRGKTLPSAFQWEKAAKNGGTTPIGITLPWGLSPNLKYHANLASTGTVPTGLLEFGMSPFGEYDMAGNASEWLANDSSEGFFTSGASWADPMYSFGAFGAFPPFFSSDRLGFRCVLNDRSATGDQGAFRFQLEDETPHYTPAPDAQVKRWIESYQYEKTPLDAKVVETVQTSEWTREKIEFAGARGARALGYLYLPTHYPKPFQAIEMVPGGDVFYRFRTVPESIEEQSIAFVRAGRALFVVVLRGQLERDPPGFVGPSLDSPEYADLVRDMITDERRGLDYLETRPEIASDKIGYFYASAAGSLWIPPALDSRYRAVAAFGAGIRKQLVMIRGDILALNFLPYIKAPVFLVHGRYDENSPVKNELDPLIALLNPHPRPVFFEGGHRPDAEFMIPRVNDWFSSQFGPVRRD